MNNCEIKSLNCGIRSQNYDMLSQLQHDLVCYHLDFSSNNSLSQCHGVRIITWLQLNKEGIMFSNAGYPSE